MKTPQHTPGPWQVGRKLPYIMAVTRPEHIARNCHYVSAGIETGGNGWPHAASDQNDFGYTPQAMEANARLIAAAPDHALVARALATVPFCRWEPFEGKAGSSGELLFNGTRYSTNLDEWGVPILTDLLRKRLTAYFAS